MGRLFGTDGIRGIAGSELTAETGLRLGYAVATVLKEKGIEHPRVLIGRDTRISGELFEDAISAGLMACGADALILSVTTTPAVAYLVRELSADAGIMISASHNSAEHNGLKVFGGDGFKLDDRDEDRVEQMILGTLPVALASGMELGRRIDRSDAVLRYEEHVRAILLQDATPSERRRRILFDLSNGSACATARAIFAPLSSLGIEADFVAEEGRGEEINRGCGSTHIASLAKRVTEEGYDMGFAFDGDADRCLAVDEKGNLLDGDMLIARLARDLKERGRPGSDTVVVTILTNLAFHHYCAERDIKVAVTAVGDRYVLREMLRIGAGIGGEQSGHIILPEYATTGDGQVTAAVAIGILLREGNKTASQVFGEMKPLPQVAKNVIVPNAKKEEVLAQPELVAVTDQIRQLLNGKGRVLIRPSGTEALVRIMLEGEDQNVIEGYAARIAETVEGLCGAL